MLNMSTEVEAFENIVEAVKKESKLDLFGVTADLLIYLPYEYAKELLKPEVTEEEWNKKVKPLTRENVIKEMEEYMEFALNKARDHRGISASRSIEHYRMWLFLLKDYETLAFINEDRNYQNYGCPMLKKICDKYSFQYPPIQEMYRMADGLPCVPGCTMGCGE